MLAGSERNEKLNQYSAEPDVTFSSRRSRAPVSRSSRRMELNDPIRQKGTVVARWGVEPGDTDAEFQARHMDVVNKGTMHRAGFSAKTRINRHDFGVS
jgi:polyisoprenoid-binding protein YceI